MSILVNNVEVNFGVFSDGAIRLEPLDLESIESTNPGGEGLHVLVKKCEDATNMLMQLALLKDALDHFVTATYTSPVTINLIMPYMPYARADRQFEKGLGIPVKVAANMINAMGWDTVSILDPHSDVTPALLDNVHVLDAAEVWDEQFEPGALSEYVVCAPDAGAAKKAFAFAKTMGCAGFVQAEKIRDVTTGKIVRCRVSFEGFVPEKVVIVDDIADGGASFEHLGAALKDLGVREVLLLISHGVFTKGLELDNIDGIYSLYQVGNYY